MDNDGMITTSSVVNVFIDVSASVILTNPTNKSRFVWPTNINLAATVSDPNGTVAQVQFVQGTTVFGTSTNAPYSLIWSNPLIGAYALTAKATDGYGLVSTSSVASFVVAGVVITNPVNNVVLTAPADVTFNANVVDNVGIASVQYFQGTNSFGIVTSAPYNLAWTNVAAGTYSITAVALNNNGQLLTSNPINVIVDTNPLTSDRDGDGVSDYLEYLEGRNPLMSGSVPDTNNVINFQTYTPLH